MVTKRRTDIDTDLAGESSEAFASYSEDSEFEPPKPAKPKPTRVYFYPLPNYAADRRYDTRVRDSENAMMLPYTDGYLERFKQTALPGWYFVELRAGREILGGDVHEVRPEAHNSNSMQYTPAAGYGVQPQQNASDKSSARSISDTAEVIRETKSLISELTPPQRAQESIDIKSLMRELKSEIVAELKDSQSAAQQDPFALLERVIDLQKKLQPESPPQRIAPDIDDETRFGAFVLKNTGALKEMFRGLREVVKAPEQIDEPEEWGEWLRNVARDAMPYVMPYAAPMVGQVLSRVNPDVLAQKINTPPQPAPPMQEAPPTQPLATANVPTAQGAHANDEVESFDDALAIWFDDTLIDLQKGADVTEAAQDYISLIEDFQSDEPQKVAEIETLMQQPAFAVVQLLVTRVPQLAALNTPATVEWIALLQAAISAHRSPPPIVPPDISASNGQHRSAEVA
jgi:hypothetical protein